VAETTSLHSCFKYPCMWRILCTVWQKPVVHSNLSPSQFPLDHTICHLRLVACYGVARFTYMSSCGIGEHQFKGRHLLLRGFDYQCGHQCSRIYYRGFHECPKAKTACVHVQYLSGKERFGSCKIHENLCMYYLFLYKPVEEIESMTLMYAG
jgi:hypothetical protein